MNWFLLFSGTLAAAVMGGGYWGFQKACGRVKDVEWTNEEALRNSAWKDFAESIPVAAQWLERNNAQPVEITSFDGLTLRGKWVPVENSKATIILFHGYHSHYLHDFGAIFSLYHAMGLNLLMVRQRAVGESEGKYITFGVRERKDVLSWVKFHNETHGMDNVYLGGMSMGASTVLFAAGEDLPDNVRGIVADCGFTSPYDIMGEVIGKSYHLPAKPILPLINFYTRRLAGFDLKECSTPEALAKASVPVLMIHGTGDDFVPSHMSQTGYDACISEKRLILAEGAGHGLSFLYDQENILNALVDFYNKNLSPQYQQEE